MLESSFLIDKFAIEVFTSSNVGSTKQQTGQWEERAVD